MSEESKSEKHTSNHELKFTSLRGDDGKYRVYHDRLMVGGPFDTPEEAVEHSDAIAQLVSDYVSCILNTVAEQINNPRAGICLSGIKVNSMITHVPAEEVKP